MPATQTQQTAPQFTCNPNKREAYSYICRPDGRSMTLGQVVEELNWLLKLDRDAQSELRIARAAINSAAIAQASQGTEP